MTNSDNESNKKKNDRNVKSLKTKYNKPTETEKQKEIEKFITDHIEVVLV